jgi:CRISPR system Cascade subunit CasB
MTDFAQKFVSHLDALSKAQPGAMATLRRSLGFDPGAYPPVYPYVERFVAADRHDQDPQRLALYLLAGLYALHPKQDEWHNLGGSLALSMRIRDQKQGGSIESRFIALLGTDANSLPAHLRQVVSLLAADDLGLNYVALLDDLRFYLNNRLNPDVRDRIRQRWARDFYRELAHSNIQTSSVNQD